MSYECTLHMCCKVLYFILLDDDFEINRVNNLQRQPPSCLESNIVFSRCLVFTEFVFALVFLNFQLNVDWGVVWPLVIQYVLIRYLDLKNILICIFRRCTYA